MPSPYEVPDRTRVDRRVPIPIRMSPEQVRAFQLRKLQEATLKKQANLSDANKSEYYKNLQNFYNQNIFGNGLQGQWTNFDYNTAEGQQAIQSTYDYAYNNAEQFITSAGLGMIPSTINNAVKGVLPKTGGYLGKVGHYNKYKIGQGAEAIAIRNSPFTVGKFSVIPVREMNVRNAIPNTVPSRYIGHASYYGRTMPTYLQRKVRILNNNNYGKHIKRLDKAMKKKGFEVFEDPLVVHRAYTDGKVVIDDIGPNNVGLDMFNRPKLIDFSMTPMETWVSGDI